MPVLCADETPNKTPSRPPPDSCGTWISPRNQYVAHGACSWESWMFTTLAVTGVLDFCAPRVLYNTP
eukprot:1195368-Prorocentrum_minimum.AAC.3